MRQAPAVAALGGAAGLGLTLAGGRLVSRFLTGIRPADPLALAALRAAADHDGHGRLPAGAAGASVDPWWPCG